MEIKTHEYVIEEIEKIEGKLTKKRKQELVEAISTGIERAVIDANGEKISIFGMLFVYATDLKERTLKAIGTGRMITVPAQRILKASVSGKLKDKFKNK